MSLALLEEPASPSSLQLDALRRVAKPAGIGASRDGDCVNAFLAESELARLEPVALDRSRVVATDDEEADEDFEGEIETPDFEGLEDFDDEDFDDEFDDDFEEELEDEYDFDEFDENVNEDDLDDEEGDLPLDGDFVDEDAEEEKVEPTESEEE